MTDLIDSAKSGNLERIRQLILEGGVDVNYLWPPEGTTSIYWAACNGHVAVCDWLINHGADVNLASAKSGSLPIHAAADRGHSSCVFLLLRRGSHIDRQTTSNGDTALHLAAYRGHVNVCRLLLGHNACVSIVNKQGRTSLEEATTRGHSEIFHLIHQHQHALCRRCKDLRTDEIARHLTDPPTVEESRGITSPVFASDIDSYRRTSDSRIFEISKPTRNDVRERLTQNLLKAASLDSATHPSTDQRITNDLGCLGVGRTTHAQPCSCRFHEWNISPQPGIRSNPGTHCSLPRMRRKEISVFGVCDGHMSASSDDVTSVGSKDDSLITRLTKKISLMESYAENLQLELTKRDDELERVNKENKELKKELESLRNVATGQCEQKNTAGSTDGGNEFD